MNLLYLNRLAEGTIRFYCTSGITPFLYISVSNAFYILLYHQYGNYGFSWGSDMLQPQSRSTHLVYHFNTIVFDVIEKLGKNIYISDGYWLTLPRPDHTQTSTTNEVGKHLVHPGLVLLLLRIVT